ncbi:glutathione transferase GstA [Piscinibacter sakaiensis]|uniref:Glutathione S-transferase n=1 Tax=Piscinibacter sakaiensis TaxID=1547922 RepID=A0A0K8P017_PISS1|nr:glutathione transferase GstA [Piscinibacter sakaiensis]GAP35976.1 glutathione S-transferase [Piscinibacter sakaiensis]
MKLYYSPGACSLSPHIVLHESGLPFEAVFASTKTKKLQDGTDYRTINPKGYVPLLELDDGQRLAEGPAIVQYIADQVPERRLAPPAGTMPRYRLQEWLTFIGTELHKTFSPLFNPAIGDEAKAVFRQKLVERFGYVDGQLADRTWLLGDEFSVADAYLYTVSRWAAPMGVDLGALTHLAAFRARMEARPSVQAALKAEGLAG